MGTLEGRSAIVTGAGRGIGRAIAARLAREGARLVINDLDLEPVEETAAEVRKLGAQVSICLGDVAATDFGERVVKQTLQMYGTLDILINNAGYIWNTTIQHHTDEQWYAMMDVHATSQFRILRAAGNYFRGVAKREQAQGHLVFRKVVNITSVMGIFGGSAMVSYASGKAAVLGLTKSLAKEWGRYAVNVNAVALGAISTRLSQTWGEKKPTIDIHDRQLPVGFPPGGLDEYSNITPLGRPGTPEEAAGAVYLLCLPDANYITGHILVCSGGLTI